MDDLGDQVQGVLRAQPEPDQRDIGMFPGCGYRDFHDVDLAGDHVVSEPDHDLGKQLQPIASFVRDQDTQMLYVALERRVRHVAADSTPRVRLARESSAKSSRLVIER